MTKEMQNKINLKKIFKKTAKNRLVRWTGFVVSCLIFAIALLFASFNLIYADRVLPHTYIGEHNFGGLKRPQAQAILKDLVSQSQDGELSFSFADKDYSQTIQDLEVDFLPKEGQTFEGLLAVGRSGPLKKVLREQIRSVFGKNQIQAAFDINQDKLKAFLDKIAQEIDILEKDAQIQFKDGEPYIIEEKIGRRFPLEENQSIALRTIGEFKLTWPTPFLVIQVYPKINSKIAKEALIKTEALIDRHLILENEKKTFHILPKDMPEFLDFTVQLNKGVLGEQAGQDQDLVQEMLSIYVLEPTISPEKVGLYTEKIATEVFQEPRDPKFTVSGGKVVAFQLAQTGYVLDKEKATQLIVEALTTGEKKVELPIKVTKPSIANNPAEAGIKELIGEGTTDFSGSPENRRHNIKVGAMAFNGVLVKPGEEFSMLKYLGEVDASSGYLPELVIKEDRTIPEYGGGLCQVSTTMFRAALNSGLKITERQNHSYRVRYYEPPVGMDATIYIPKPDFKFLNEMETPILIQTSVGANTLTFSFYGTKDGRRAETTDPVIWDVTGSGEGVYSESADLAAGEIKQIEKAHPGSKASFEYRVYDVSGKLINEQKFLSSYVPWPARYLYGPGTTGIPGREAPPPAEQPAQPPPAEQPPPGQ